MLVQPTVELAKRFSRQRIAPLIETTPVLAHRVSDPRERDSANTILAKEFPGGVLEATGANSAVGLRSSASSAAPGACVSFRARPALRSQPARRLRGAGRE